MKQARAADYWRGLGKRSPQNRIKSIRGVSVQNFPAAPIPVPGAITVITGLNGVGKSTLIHAAHLALQRGANVVVKNAALRATTGELNCEIFEGAGTIETRVALATAVCTHTPPDLPVAVSWIDPGFEVPALIKAFREEKHLDEALAQVQPKSFSKDEVAELSHIVGKTYEECSAYELEGFADRDVCPYFWVKAHGQEYGTEAMGLGEASLHYIHWALTRLQPGSVILLEEPETYVSARSQGALMDRLAEVCLRNNCSAIITTHSPHVFAKVPPAHTLILVREPDGVKVVIRDSARTRMMALAVPPDYQKHGMILVEDRVARIFAKAWLWRSDPDLLVRWRVTDHTSVGAILKCLEHFPQTEGWFGAVGLLDGDERPKGHQSARPLCFLPGDQAPEVIIRDAIIGAPKKVAELLAVDPEEFAIAVSAIEGMEHHDWLIELEKAAKIPVDRLIDSAFVVWSAEKKNAEKCEEALKALNDGVAAAGSK
jgi:predicted ATPase